MKGLEMKAKKLTTYVLMVSRFFPGYHPRKGQDTNFPMQILHAVKNGTKNPDGSTNRVGIYAAYINKIHTIRGNYDLWKKRIDKVNEGKAVLSLRYWSGKPYHSEQVEFLQLTKAGIQRAIINFRTASFHTTYLDWWVNEGNSSLDYPLEELSVVASNDGLSEYDLRAWFQDNKNSGFHGCVIHFTDFRY